MNPLFHSMAAFLFFLLFSAVNAVAAQRRHSNISLGSSLTPTGNSSWLSPSGLYAFGFFQQNKGYAVGIFIAGIPEKTVVWTLNTGNPTVSGDASLQLTRDGRLILQQREHPDSDITNSVTPIASASMLDSGNFVLYSGSSTIIWQSFDNPTDTLLPGQRLPPGRELFSSASETNYARGIFRLKMQTDGNLVQYPVNTPDTAPYSYYSSFTDGKGNNVSLNLNNDGHLYLLNGSSILKNLSEGVDATATESTIYLLRIDADGILRLHSRSLNQEAKWTISWSPTEDKCAPKGLCGLNSFCILMDEVPNCECLPGFRKVQSGNWTAGCTRNSIAQGCGNDSRVTYEIRSVDNTAWEDNSYAAVDTVNTEEECRRACLDDCNCEVAFFQDRQCTKQMLPLRYGRRSLSDSINALVKVSTLKSTPEAGGGSANSVKQVKKELGLDILGISISLFVVGALFIVISVIYVRKKNWAYKKIAQPEVILGEDVTLRAFNYSDLAQATNDFKEELGKGSSGTVFKGFLNHNQKLVAVKMLEKEFVEGEKEFRTELKTIGKTYHRNLVRLLGYCLDGPKRLLVFEYMSNGSLADVLFKPENRPIWDDRIRIGRDIARGILYLHEECERQIIHCDIKPQNILMDEHGCAKISDFGLAKLLKQDQTNTYTGIRGTKGYVAPEWHHNQPVTVKADVYSFGIVLLEIICCRRSINWNLAEDEAILEEWVYNCYEAGELGKLVGNEIVDKRKLGRMVKIGLWCIQYEPSLRPSMKKVLLMLEGTVDIPVPPNPTSFLSSI